MEDYYNVFDGCTCHNNPPCSYCTDTVNCDVCAERVYVDDITQSDRGAECVDCYTDPAREAEIILQSQIDLHISLMNVKLSLRLLEMRYRLDDQFIELKYGKGYKERFLDQVILEAHKI